VPGVFDFAADGVQVAAALPRVREYSGVRRAEPAAEAVAAQDGAGDRTAGGGDAA
jgi:hypothetical protein